MFFFFFNIVTQEEHQSLRERKKEGEPLNWEDCKKMEFTSHVRVLQLN